MFTSSSELSKILSKLSMLALIFFVINISLFIYLRDYTVAYRPLDRKSRVLFSRYPNPKVIIGGDSIAESGIDPLTLSSSGGINLASPAAGIQGFRKALEKYLPMPLTKENILIINVSTLSFNDEVISNEHFAGQVDGFLNAGPTYFIKHWKKDYFKNMFNLYQCSLTSCPYLADTSYPGLESSTHCGFIPLMPTFGGRTTLSERKTMFGNFEDYYKNLKLDGVLFDGYKKDLSRLVATQAKVFIVFLPSMSALKLHIDEHDTTQKFQNFIKKAKAECEHYTQSCYFLDYYNWDHSLLPGSDEENYYDYIHFSPEGGKRLSSILKHDIELKLNGYKI